MRQLEKDQTEVCLDKGWQEREIQLGGHERKLLWKSTFPTWKRGVIIVLHGGGGSHAHWCGDLRISKTMINFVELALDEGFAVFSLDSLLDIFVDNQGYPCGKRFDFTARPDVNNIDLPFIEAVLDDIIPALRPPNSSEAIFMVGISNGGFLTVRAATRFDDKVTAFAAVSSGDPYGTTLICDPNHSKRAYAPGLWLDRDTKQSITEDGACVASAYQNEFPWESANPAQKPPFRQFHHEGDVGVNVSCMRKTQQLLIQHGYRDAGAFVIKHRGRKRLKHHFWQEEYNRPLIEFFKNSSLR